MTSRREFLVRAASPAASGATLPASAEGAKTVPTQRSTETTSLCGEWLFRIDPQDVGTKEDWFKTASAAADWLKIQVPHTWQVQPSLADYRGVAWYCRNFDVPEHWMGSTVRIEFAAVYLVDVCQG